VPAGTALYRVLAVKHSGGNVCVAVDGGMSDSSRPALYGVRYAPRLTGRHSTAERARVTVVARHREAGGMLAADAELPADVRPGDLLAVPVAGACHLSTAPGHRPPVAAVRDGRARLLVPRESLADMRGRHVGL
jgi:diaminopimelate decarboxylase